jgi:hypothetical protein
MMKVMPYGMVAILLSIVVVTVLYAKMFPAGGGAAIGLIYKPQYVSASREKEDWYVRSGGRRRACLRLLCLRFLQDEGPGR